MTRAIGWITGALLTAALTCGTHSSAQTTSRYWEWGWGTYGGAVPLDVARYDWSLINFGNVAADARAVDRCNELLRLNPEHKLVIRVWPIMGKGDCKQNRYQATLFHFVYSEKAREAVLRETERQVKLIIDGVDLPQNVVGLTFLEELPGHFTSSPFKKAWQEGDPLPWGIERFAGEIERELGAPFDMTSSEHRLWWGKKYCDALEAIHRTMKQASGGRLVLYWQATAYYNLDHLQPGDSLVRPRIVPVQLRDIVKPGVCDGIFGYPNNAAVWQKQTQAIVEKLQCLCFSQTSTPAFMRLSKFDDLVRIARWENPGNLGTFVYMQAGRGSKAWNELPYLDGKRYWTTSDHARKFAWDYQIGMDTVRRQLAPQVALDYDLRGKRRHDFIHVFGQVSNPRDLSWFSGNQDEATLRQVKVTLSVPDGFSLPVENSPPATIDLGAIGPRQVKAPDWWVRVDGDGTMPAGQAFSLKAEADGGVVSDVSCTELDVTIPACQPREIRRSGDRWVEPAYRLPTFQPALELTGRNTDVIFPGLECEGRSVLFRGLVPSDTRLVIGPGYVAKLVRKPMFDRQTRTFAKHRGEGAEFAAFSTGYPVYRSPPVKVRQGGHYTLRVTGRVADGAVFHALVMFFGQREGKQVQDGKSCLFNALKADRFLTVEKTVDTPSFEADPVTACVYFYCHERKGTLQLKSFDLSLADIPEDGLDVTANLEGVLPELQRPFTAWTYHDRCDPARGGTPRVDLRFFDPSASGAAAGPDRQGADDF